MLLPNCAVLPKINQPIPPYAVGRRCSKNRQRFGRIYNPPLQTRSLPFSAVGAHLICARRLSKKSAKQVCDRAAGNVCKGLRPLKVNCPKGKRSWPEPCAFNQLVFSNFFKSLKIRTAWRKDFFDTLKAAHRELLPHVKKDVSPRCHTGFQRGVETVAKTTVQQDLHRGSYCSYFTHFLTISAIWSILDSMSLTSLNWVRQRSRL